MAMAMTENQTSSTNSSATTEDLFKKPDLACLNGYYTDADSIDQDVFAEMRSAVLLVAGEHYAKKESFFYKRIRDTKELSKEQKLRLVKNHVRKICQVYANNIMSNNPGVGFTAKDDASTHDLKAAELNHSVWRDAFDKYNLEDKLDDWCDSFVQIGEVHVKLFWDPNAGPVAGYEPMVDENNEQVTDEFGQLTADDSKPVPEGRFVFEEIYGFNLLRPPECKDLRTAEWLGLRKMTDRNDLIRRFGLDKADVIPAEQDETYLIFDITKGGYRQSKRQTMVREYYFRPSLMFPNGYYYITTKNVILAEGELPGGLFPIVSQWFDRLQTTPRGRSPVKTMRPYQAEINRAASKMAEHQITLGDDKLIIQNGSKVSSGASLPGVRTINVSGQSPTILPGRDGSQYLNTVTTNISELYSVMMVEEDSQQDIKQLDAYTLLFQSARQKKKFQRYTKKFEKFYVQIVKLYLQLAKIHLPDDAVIWAIGKNEQVNLEEFRRISEVSYEIKVEAQSDDVETKLGKQLVANHIIQYAGAQLDKDSIGKIMRSMPYVNDEESFDDLTIDYDSALNFILALDRGERPQIGQQDNHVYMMKRLSMRMRKSDFKFLSPEIQQNYNQAMAMHSQFETQNQMAISRAEQGFIPTDGALIPVDFYVNAPDSRGGVKQVKVKVPYAAIDWLLKQLQSQGSMMADMQDFPSGVQATMANNLTGAMAPQGQPPMSSLQQNQGVPQMPQQSLAPQMPGR